MLLRDDGSIVIMDFGMVGHLTDEVRRGTADLFLAMQRHDAHRLSDRLIQLAPPPRPIDRAALVQRMVRLLERYLSDNAERIAIGAALHELLELIRTFGLRSPASLTLLFKTLAITDGLVLAITPDKPLTQYLEPIAERVATSRLALDDWANRAKTSALDAAELSIELPRHADRVLADVERGNLRVWARIEDAESLFGRMERMVERANASMLASAFIVGMAVLFSVYHPAGWSAIAWIFWLVFAIAAIVVARTALGTIRSRRQ